MDRRVGTHTYRHIGTFWSLPIDKGGVVKHLYAEGFTKPLGTS